MILLRNKNFSLFGKIVDRLKSTGNRLKEKILKFRYRLLDSHDIKKTKIFSYFEPDNISDIPGYDELYNLSMESKKIILREFSKDEAPLFTQDFPFLSIPPKDTIIKWREDYKRTSRQDLVEVIFIYNGGIVFYYDFDNEVWFIKDKMGDQVKEVAVGRDTHNTSDTLKSLAAIFNPDINEFLKHKLDSISDQYQSLEGKTVGEVFETTSSMFNSIFKSGSDYPSIQLSPEKAVEFRKWFSYYSNYIIKNIQRLEIKYKDK